jgi:hypothetical protein
MPFFMTVEKFALDDLRRRYLYQRSEGQLLEGAVTLMGRQSPPNLKLEKGDRLIQA